MSDIVMLVGTSVQQTPAFQLPNSISVLKVKQIYGGIVFGQHWYFPAYYPFGYRVYQDLKREFPALQCDAQAIAYIRELKRVHDEWTQTVKAFETKQLLSLPAYATVADQNAFQHQIYGAHQVRYWWRSFFLWKMGTGKTRTLIEGIRLLQHDDSRIKKVLVLAPPIVLPTWLDQVARWTNGQLTAAIYDGSDKSIAACEGANFMLMSYARPRIDLRDRNGWLYNVEYDVIVADESHMLGNIGSQQTKAALYLSTKAKRRYLLSGTAADHPGKLYPQLRFLSPSLLAQTWTEYQNKYFKRLPNSPVVYGYKNLEQLNGLVNTVATRMDKKDCLDLPPVTICDVHYELTTEQRLTYDACIARLRDQSLYQNSELTGHGLDVANGAVLINKLLQILSGFYIENPDRTICDQCPQLQTCVENNINPHTRDCSVHPTSIPRKVKKLANHKLTAFKQLLQSILSSDHDNKVIVWATYTEELDDLAQVLTELQLDFVRMDGKHTHRIAAAQEQFQTDPKCVVWLGQISSGVGVTLTAANYVIYYSLTWTLVYWLQSLDRNHRPGQTRNVTVYRLLSDNLVAADQFLAKTLLFKDAVAYTLLQKVACLTCDRQQTCTKQQIHPFSQRCKYAADVALPKARTVYLEVRQPHENDVRTQ